MVDTKQYIWIQDAAAKYKVSRPYLAKQVDNGKLTYAKFAGDQKVYLLIAELEEFFKGPIIQEKKPPK